MTMLYSSFVGCPGAFTDAVCCYPRVTVPLTPKALHCFQCFCSVSHSVAFCSNLHAVCLSCYAYDPKSLSSFYIVLAYTVAVGVTFVSRVRLEPFY